MQSWVWPVQRLEGDAVGADLGACGSRSASLVFHMMSPAGERPACGMGSSPSAASHSPRWTVLSPDKGQQQQQQQQQVTLTGGDSTNTAAELCSASPSLWGRAYCALFGSGGGASSSGSNAGAGGGNRTVTGVPAGPSTPWPTTPVVFRTCDGRESSLEVADDMRVSDLACYFAAKAGSPPGRVRLLVHELPPLPPLDELSIANLARTVGRGGGSAGGSAAVARRLLSEWAGYFVLPEAVNRELKGAGLVSWTYRRLLLALRTMRGGYAGGGIAAICGDGDGSQPPASGWLVSVHTLQGEAAVLEVGLEVDAAGLRGAVHREMAIPPARQRIVVYEVARSRGATAALTRLLVRNALLHLSLAIACLDIARGIAVLTPLGSRLLGARGGAATAIVQVECNGKGYSLELPETATLKEVAHIVKQRERQSAVARIC